MSSEPIRLTIPDSELPNIRLLAETEEDILLKLLEALSKERPSLDVRALSKSIAERTGLELAQIEPIISLLRRWAVLQRRFGVSTETLLSLLNASLQQFGGQQWSAEDADQWRKKQKCIAQFLVPGNALALGAKAGELLLEQQIVFCNAKILTDVRPVFNEDVERIEGLLPFHVLAITYHEGSETREIHLSMDKNDISELRDLLLRAEHKEELLRNDLTKLGLTVIETGSDADA